MRAIGQLSGQEYVDTYAPKKARVEKAEDED
jgi:hypothetical protein